MYLLLPGDEAEHDSNRVGHDLTGSGARTCTRARRSPLPHSHSHPRALSVHRPRRSH